MRWMVLLCFGVLAFSQGPALFRVAQERIWPPENPHVESAIAIRCQGADALGPEECADHLRREFEAGTRNPEQIVRQHCTRFSNRWAGDGDPAPAICEEMYGGWI